MRSPFLFFCFLLFGLAWVLASIACSDPEPMATASRPSPERILFDTDMGSDCDDAGALALLHTYVDEGKAELIGCVYSSGRVPYGAAVVQAINAYYGRGDVPVGAYHGDDLGDPVDKMLAEKLARDTAAFGHTIIHNREAPDQTALSRELLLAQPDTSVVYVTVGHTKGLYDLMVSPPDSLSELDGMALIQQKVKRWVALGGLKAVREDSTRAKDWNFFFNGTAPFTDTLLDRFPRPMVFVDAGSEVMTGKGLLYTPPGNIVRTAYRDWLWNYSQKTLEDQRPSWDLATVYYAVEGTGAFLQSEGPGKLLFDPEKGCRWEAALAPTRQTYVRQQAGQGQPFADYLNELLARRPLLNK